MNKTEILSWIQKESVRTVHTKHFHSNLTTLFKINLDSITGCTEINTKCLFKKKSNMSLLSHVKTRLITSFSFLNKIIFIKKQEIIILLYTFNGFRYEKKNFIQINESEWFTSTLFLGIDRNLLLNTCSHLNDFYFQIQVKPI